ncbi:MAG: SRPBCC domain-containing protein [Polyangiaceae bacterium]
MAESGLRISFERVYDGPVDDLWALWTTKNWLEEWYAPERMHVEMTAVDPRLGGAFDHVMTALTDEHRAYMARVGRSTSTRVRGQFVEVVRHERLRIRMTVDFVPDVEPYPYDIVVEFQPEGARVRMIVTADSHPDSDMTRRAGEALASQLRRFDAALASRRKG